MLDPGHGGRALVLAAGGVAGIAWELGLLAGLQAADVDLTAADVVIGTSAGAAVGVCASSGAPLDEAIDRMLASDAERQMPYDVAARRVFLAQVVGDARDEVEAASRIGRMALATKTTVSAAERRAIIKARLPVTGWPDRALRVNAVDAISGTTVTFDRSSDVPLVDAVAASCAVPGVWPAVQIGARWYVDGGARSYTNADLAAGSARVVIACPSELAARPRLALDRELAMLKVDSEVTFIGPDAHTLAVKSSNPLDPAQCETMAAEGRRQAASFAVELRRFWNPAR
jgi:NTE family protein